MKNRSIVSISELYVYYVGFFVVWLIGLSKILLILLVFVLMFTVLGFRFMYNDSCPVICLSF